MPHPFNMKRRSRSPDIMSVWGCEWSESLSRANQLRQPKSVRSSDVIDVSSVVLDGRAPYGSGDAWSLLHGTRGLCGRQPTHRRDRAIGGLRRLWGKGYGQSGKALWAKVLWENFSKPTASNLPQLSPLPAIERGTPTILRRLCEGPPRRLDLDSDRGSLHAG